MKISNRPAAAAALLGLSLLSIGAALLSAQNPPAAAAQRKKSPPFFNNHDDVPIIIDNPKSVVTLLPKKHAQYIKESNEGRKWLVNHKEITEFKIVWKTTGQPVTKWYAFKAPLQVNFDHIVANQRQPAGTLAYSQAGPDNQLYFTDYSQTSTLQWKLVDGQTSDHKLKARNDAKDYRVRSVTSAGQVIWPETGTPIDSVASVSLTFCTPYAIANYSPCKKN